MCVTARESVAKRHARIPTSRAASATATANHERMLSVAASWFNSSVSGYCEPTERKGDPQLVCLSGARKGYWTLTANESAAWPAAVETCLAYCRACPSCAYLSVSPADQECSFFASCDLGALQTRLSASYRSGAVLAASAEAGASWEAELDAAELDAAISPSDEIACALRRLRRSGRSPSVAILGSSITSGRGKHGRALTPYGTLLPRLLPWSPGNVSAYGYPGASLMYLAACLRRFLPQHDADVYVIEVVDNMMIGGKEAHREVQDAITHIIEELRARKRRNSGDAAVVLLLPLPQSCVSLRCVPRRPTVETWQIWQISIRRWLVASTKAVGHSRPPSSKLQGKLEWPLRLCGWRWLAGCALLCALGIRRLGGSSTPSWTTKSIPTA